MNKLYICSLLFCMIILPTLSVAQEDKALARAQFMLRQVNAEKSQIQQELMQLKQDYEELRAQSERKISQLEKSEKKLKAALANWKDGHESVSSDLEETSKQLLDSEKRAEILKNLLLAQSNNYDVCKVQNENLVGVNEELVKLYENKGFSDVFRNREPITGLTKVRVENKVQDLQHTIEDNNLEKNTHLLEEVSLETIEEQKQEVASDARGGGIEN